MVSGSGNKTLARTATFRLLFPSTQISIPPPLPPWKGGVGGGGREGLDGALYCPVSLIRDWQSHSLILYCVGGVGIYWWHTCSRQPSPWRTMLTLFMLSTSPIFTRKESPFVYISHVTLTSVPAQQVPCFTRRESTNVYIRHVTLTFVPAQHVPYVTWSQHLCTFLKWLWHLFLLSMYAVLPGGSQQYVYIYQVTLTSAPAQHVPILPRSQHMCTFLKWYWHLFLLSTSPVLHGGSQHMCSFLK